MFPFNDACYEYSQCNANFLITVFLLSPFVTMCAADTCIFGHLWVTVGADS